MIPLNIPITMSANVSGYPELWVPTYSLQKNGGGGRSSMWKLTESENANSRLLGAVHGLLPLHVVLGDLRDSPLQQTNPSALILFLI